MRFWQSATQQLPDDLVNARFINTEGVQGADEQCRTAVQLFEQGRDNEALLELRRVLARDKHCVEAHYNLGLLYARRNEPRKAAKHYEEVVRWNPRSAAAFNQLGLAYGKLGRIVEAIKSFIQAIRVSSDCFEAYGNLAMLYFNGGRYPEAINTCERALRVNANYAHAHYILALIHVDLHCKESALREYQLLKRLDEQLASELVQVMDKEFRPFSHRGERSSQT